MLFTPPAQIGCHERIDKSVTLGELDGPRRQVAMSWVHLVMTAAQGSDSTFISEPVLDQPTH